MKTKAKHICSLLLALCLTASLFVGTPTVAAAESDIWLMGGGIAVEVDNRTSIAVYLVDEAGNMIPLTQSLDTAAQTGYIRLDNTDQNNITDFVMSDSSLVQNVSTMKGKALGDRLTVKGISQSTGIIRTIILETDYSNPNVVYMTTSYCAPQDTEIFEFVENDFAVIPVDPPETGPKLYAYMGAAVKWGDDDVFPVPNGSITSWPNRFSEFGGTPIVDLWSRGGGIAIASAAETNIAGLSLPVKSVGDNATVSIRWRTPTFDFNDDTTRITLAEGVDTVAGTSLLIAHTGDFYNGVKAYAAAMKHFGVGAPPISELTEEAYSPRWESWGYTTNWTVDTIINQIPILQRLGIKEVTIDFGWYIETRNTAENNGVPGPGVGDYIPDPEKFPNGEDDIRRMVKACHDAGMLITLWIKSSNTGYTNGKSGAAFIGTPSLQMQEQHDPRQIPPYLNDPHIVIRNPDGSPSWARTPWGDVNDYHLCLAYEPVWDWMKKWVEKVITPEDQLTSYGEKGWGFDGFKNDSIVNAAPCYDPTHNHESPWDPVHQWGPFHKMIYDTARSIKPYALIEICNCGVPQNIYNFCGQNQPIPGDYAGTYRSRQARLRIKVLKAIYGPTYPVLGDHVELAGFTPSTRDFAYQLGAGAVLETKFTTLTESEEAYYKKWFDLGNELKLSSGEYIGDLYTYGFDFPEAYVIKQNGNMYYAFYTAYPRNGYVDYNGDVELRGLTPGQFYKITDYVNDIEYGVIKATSSTITLTDVSFTNSLLLCAEPITPDGIVCVSDATTLSNEEVSVKVSLKNFANIGGIKVTLNYDASKLQVENIEQSPLITGAVNATEPGTIIFNAINADGIPVGGTSFDVATITFKAASLEEDVHTPVSIVAVEACDDNVNPLQTINVENGSVWIICDKLGDVNSDGRVNYMDALIILKSINRKITLTDRQAFLADYNRNNSINIDDVICILRADVGLPN
ncbi:MAG TPA: hypothetical protein GXX14_08725 [Clostridiaceae bacterium]|nr:hypothetical protein [Clostridiaceae bacterium]